MGSVEEPSPPREPYAELISLAASHPLPPLRLTREEHTVGHEDECCFHLPHAGVDAVHARFTRTALSVAIRDCSAHGVWVNGSRIDKDAPRELQDGDTLHFVDPTSANSSSPAACAFRFISRLPPSSPFPSSPLPSSPLPSSPLPSSPLPTASAPLPAATDAMESDLTCAICQDLLHHPVALQPCLHAFCAGCYSKWMARHAHCPHCRAAVRLVSRHHALHSLVAAFLALHPHKRRPAAELAALDAADAIGSQPLRVRKRTAPHAADADADADADAALRRLAERRPDALPRAALGNAFERQVLSDLIASKGITCAQFLQECLVRLETGEFHLPPPLSADSAICDECTDAAVCSLSYQFRAAVPPQELPPHVAARSDCWYGHECRTQRHNAPHAARLNHICAPTPRGGGFSVRRVGA